jgi:hypothetical protein
MSLREQIRKPLTAEQMEMVDVIDREFSKAGLPPEFAAAAVVNSWYESKLNPTIRSGYVSDAGVREDSVGLFQLNIKGAGAGMILPDGTDQRKDPVLNTKRIIKEVNSHWGEKMRQAYASGDRKVSTYSYHFAHDIERPADRVGQGNKRADLTLEFFPNDSVKGRLLPVLSTPKKIAVGIFSLSLLSFTYYYFFVRRT